MSDDAWSGVDAGEAGGDPTEVVAMGGQDADSGHDVEGRFVEEHAELPNLDLLVWDAPNIDMTLSNVIGGRPTPASRPRFDAVARWLLAAAGDGEVEGCVFANVPPGGAVSMRGWIEAIRSFGYAVFARPKLGPDDDVDADMLAHIDLRRHTHHLRRVVVASGDGRNFLDPLEKLARDGVDVVVLSFAEVAGYAQESDVLTFLDLEDVPGAFTQPLPRVRLDNLPIGGAWLPPTRPMRALLDDVHD
jgi:putative heme uptake system protein